MRGGNIKQLLLKYNTARRAVQLFSFILFSAIVFNLGVLPFLLPVLWTWGLTQNTVGDAFTAIQIAFYTAVFPWLGFAAFLITGILIGKSLCGWVCPFGFIQELVGFVKRKKMEISPRTHEWMIYIKYGVLALALFISVTFSVSKVLDAHGNYEKALGIFAKAPFTAISPAETLFSVLPNMVLNFRSAIVTNQVWDVIISGAAGLPLIFWAQLVILIIVLAIVAFVPRGFCRYFCPHGAFMAIMNKFSFLGLKREPTKCSKDGCRLCVEACPMRVPILDLPWEKFSHEECIYCMKCVDACDNKAIKPKYP